jgi:ribosomal-protein-alanine N-acetyltransferase
MADAGAVEFRSPNRDELALLAQLQREVIPNPWSQQDFAASLDAGHQCLVALVDGRISACAAANVVAGEAELLTLATARGSQRAGIARRLLLELLTHLVGAGASACFLEVMAGNTGAIALYSEMGFEQVGRRPGYYLLPEGRVDALVMRCCLNQIEPVVKS